MNETLWTLVAVAGGGIVGYWIGHLVGWQAYHNSVIKSAIKDAKAEHGIGGEA